MGLEPLEKKNFEMPLSTRALAVFAALASAAALYDASDAVVQLTDKDFDKRTKEGIWVVEVYADW